MPSPILPPQITVDQDPPPPEVSDDLDIRIVEAGPLSTMLLSGTDDGCDTVRGSDC